ncbi:nuclear transport factor 2 family protein [Conexibacter sp. CPCC 206217]|uniref:nuclear transport factor 2 family protein n=1 Tax=Conexibacter sp. CPCC 206217 TaxID=3064574 RepID=UPI00271C11C4|nr:nuclear transport factor 2 family protein [Conexibacter sp. CPCC 206217]MDO8210114.1 nuclear transport factor 2 family protein [Conexibacter sp. CPCC 206217]
MPEIPADLWAAADPVTRFVLALDARDAERIASAFAPEGVLHAPDGSEQVGRDAIAGYYAVRADPSVEAKHVLTRLASWAGDDGVRRTACDALIVLGGETEGRLITGRYDFAATDAGVAWLRVRLGSTWRLVREGAAR